MSLIDRIDGELLRGLSGSSSSQTRSSVAGRGLGASFEDDTVELASSLTTGETIFSKSYIRLSEAISQVSLSREMLSELKNIASELGSLATRAADAAASVTDRARLNSEFEKLLGAYRTKLDETSDDEVDALSKSDLREALLGAGISPERADKLSEAFTGLSGGDGQIGYTSVDPQLLTSNEVNLQTLDDAVSSRTDPLRQDISTREGAIVAELAIGVLSRDLERDVEAVDTILEELSGASTFAFTSAVVFGSSGDKVANSRNADQLANTLVQEIRRLTRDHAVAAHSDLDKRLSSELFSFL